MAPPSAKGTAIGGTSPLEPPDHRASLAGDEPGGAVGG
jgi:hypothetical protein